MGGRGVRNVSPVDVVVNGAGMPDEIWRMTDFIMKYGQGCGSVFLERGDEDLCRGIRECLDTAREFDVKVVQDGEMGVMSMGETLLRYLDALPTSIVPAEMVDRAIRFVDVKRSAMEVSVLRGKGAECS
jgi:hypothetical protein